MLSRCGGASSFGLLGRVVAVPCQVPMDMGFFVGLVVVSVVCVGFGICSSLLGVVPVWC